MSPSARDWRLFADDVVEACTKIRRFVADMTFDAFVADERSYDAVIRNLDVGAASVFFTLDAVSWSGS